jgi:acyl-CoA synthetase
MVKDWHFDHDTVVYSFSPLTTTSDIVGLVAGGEVMIHTQLDATRAFDGVVETDATFLLGVPTHALDLVAEVRIAQHAPPRQGDSVRDRWIGRAARVVGG